jgi:hypothetical protein
VTLLSKFHPIWCLIAQESRLRRKFLGGPDIYPFFWIYPAETGHIWSKAGHVSRTVFSPTFVHCFDHILLTGCPIDPVHFYAVGWCVHHLLAGF